MIDLPAFDHAYFDESLHDAHDFMLGAFVFARHDHATAAVASALEAAHLRVGVDEFMSRLPFADNFRLQQLRSDLIQYVARETKVGIVIAPRKERAHLGKHALEGLAKVAWRNALECTSLDIEFDDGVFSSSTAALLQTEEIGFPENFHFTYRADSKVSLGLQLADLVANAASRMLIETMTGHQKRVTLGEDSGYEEGTEAALSWDLKMMLRYSFFSGRLAEPPRNDEGRFEWHLPLMDLRSFAVHTAGPLGDTLDEGVDSAFGRIWLGCIH